MSGNKRKVRSTAESAHPPTVSEPEQVARRVRTTLLPPVTVNEYFYLISTLPEHIQGRLAPFAPSTPSKIESVPVTSLTFHRILAIFGLSHSDDCLVYKDFHFIQIPNDGELDDLDIDLIAHTCSTSLLRFDFLYATIFPRETEAVCRIAVDQVLLEALSITSRAAQEWRSAIQTPHTSAAQIRQTLIQTRLRTPIGLQDSIICLAEVIVDSKVHHEEPKEASKVIGRVVGEEGVVGKDLVYTGRADYAVALRDPATRRITSYLILVEAKRDSEFSKARAQVLGYIACIWEARKAKGARLDCTTYGLASDGLKWQLIMIDHHGVVKEGKLLDARIEGWPVILQLVVAVIRRAAQLQTSNTSPAKSKSEDETTSMDDGDVLHSAETFYEQTPDEPSEGMIE